MCNIVSVPPKSLKPAIDIERIFLNAEHYKNIEIYDRCDFIYLTSPVGVPQLSICTKSSVILQLWEAYMLRIFNDYCRSDMRIFVMVYSDFCLYGPPEHLVCLHSKTFARYSGRRIDTVDGLIEYINNITSATYDIDRTYANSINKKLCARYERILQRMKQIPPEVSIDEAYIKKLPHPTIPHPTHRVPYGMNFRIFTNGHTIKLECHDIQFITEFVRTLTDDMYRRINTTFFTHMEFIGANTIDGEYLCMFCYGNSSLKWVVNEMMFKDTRIFNNTHSYMYYWGEDMSYDRRQITTQDVSKNITRTPGPPIYIGMCHGCNYGDTDTGEYDINFEGLVGYVCDMFEIDYPSYSRAVDTVLNVYSFYRVPSVELGGQYTSAYNPMILSSELMPALIVLRVDEI